MLRHTFTSMALLLACATLFGGATATHPHEVPAPICLEEVAARGIAGRLGYKLGTMIKVDGQVVDCPSPDAKADVDEPFFLQIDHINGEWLAPAVLFASRNMPLLRSNPKLKAGDNFHCAGYETGEYAGTPPSESKDAVAEATISFHFTTRFVVLSEK